MSTPLRNMDSLLEDKEFVKNYFRGVETGNDVTQRLMKDNATLNSPDLIARLVNWLEEAEPSDASSADARAQAEQQVGAMNLPSRQEEEEEHHTEDNPSGGVITGDKTGSGGESSDGSSKTPSTTSTSSTTTSSSSSKHGSFTLGGAKAGDSK